MQVFVRTLDGRTIVVDLARGTENEDAVVVSDLKRSLEAKNGVPGRHHGLATFSGRRLECSGGRRARLRDGETVLVVGHLLGGKGGFGSQLRSSRSAVRTTNFDACRDLRGRRLGGAEAERKVEEWKAREEERRLQEVAEKHLREAAKAEKRKREVKETVEDFREEVEQTSEKVACAVRDGLKRAAQLGGEKGKARAVHAVVAGAGPSSSKKPRRSFGLDAFSDSDSESD